MSGLGRIGQLRWIVGLVLVGAAFGIGLAGLLHVDAVLQRSGMRAVAHVLGPEIVVSGPIEAHLFPRPHINLYDVHLSGTSSGATLDVAEVEATQSIGSLLSGRIAFSQVRLVEPTASVDADRILDDVQRPRLNLLGYTLPGRIVVSSAVVAVRSAKPALRGLLTGFNGVLEGLDRNGAAVLSGHGSWRGQHAELGLRLEPFFDFVLGRETSGNFKLHTALLNASVEGQLHAGIHGGFEGSVAAASPALGEFLRANGMSGSMGALVQRVGFTGTGVASHDSITFSNARLALDDTPFEGSFAWQPNEGQGAWTGTFATDTLDLSRLADLLPALHDDSAHLSATPWHIDPALLGDIDLRISSNRAKIGPIEMEDAAFAALCREGRVEASLSEARSLDGLVRGRAVAMLGSHDVDLKLDLSLAQLDLDPLFQAIGSPRILGSASGHFTAEARGSNPRSLVGSIKGHGQISIRQGSLPALSSMADPSALGGAGQSAAWMRGPRAFDLVTADVNVSGPHVQIARGRLVSSDAQHSFSAEASVLDRSFSIVAADTAPDPQAGTSLAGTWDGAVRVTRLTETERPAAPEPARPTEFFP